jgi:hypothetical protein
MTAGATAANSGNNGAHSLDVAQLKLWKEIVVFAPLLLARVNWSFIAPKATALLGETL